MRYVASMVFVSGFAFNVCIVTGLPVVFAIALAMALMSGHPSVSMLFRFGLR